MQVADDPLHLGPPRRLHFGDEPLQVPRNVPGVGVADLADVLAVLIFQPVRDGRQVDAGQRRRAACRPGAELRWPQRVPGHPQRNENSMLIIKFPPYKLES